MRIVMFYLFCLWVMAGAFGQQKNVQFILTELPAKSSGQIGIRGSVPPLSWEKSLFLSKEKETWQVDLALASSTELLEYKYVIEDSKGEVTWELQGGDNRFLILPAQEGAIQQRDQWNVPNDLDVRRLPVLRPDQLAEDFRLLREAMLAIHPGIYRYNDEAAVLSHLATLEAAFQKELSYAEAYLEISRFLGKIKCGHTYANFFNQSGLIQKIILGQPDKLPFAFKLVDRRLIVTKNATADTRFDAGAEIRAINGISIAAILDSLLTVVKADGDHDAKRLNDLQVRGYDSFEAFDVYFPLFFPPVDGQYRIDAENLLTKTSFQASVASLTRSERLALFEKKRYQMPNSYDDLWDFRILDQQTGYLKLGTFTMWYFTMNWKQFLQDAFKRLEKEKIPNLILDIRDNEGGLDEVIFELGNYLVKSPCSVESFQDRTRYAKVPDSIRPFLYTWEKSVFDLSDQVVPTDHGFFTRPGGWPAPQQIPAGKKPYRGQVYLLVNAGNSSATFYLSRLMQTCGMATLVGQETGGSRRGLNAGVLFFLRLPNSKIEVDIPAIGSFSQSERPAGGVVPDLVVKPTVEAVLEGRDLEVEAVLERIR